jgi:hypothetical protein
VLQRLGASHRHPALPLPPHKKKNSKRDKAVSHRSSVFYSFIRFVMIEGYVRHRYIYIYVKTKRIQKKLASELITPQTSKKKKRMKVGNGESYPAGTNSWVRG